MRSLSNQRIVFLSDLPWERPAKIAFGLRAKGIPTTLVYVQPPPNYDPNEFFDFAIRAEDAAEAVAIVHRLRPDIVHVFSAAGDDAAALMILNKVGKVIFDYKDCFENLIAHPMGSRCYSIQRYCIENADGLCCRDLQLWNYCRVNRIRPGTKRTLFLDYGWGTAKGKADTKGYGEVHTVLAGNFSIEKTEPAQVDCGYLHTSRELVSREIHVHLYLYRQYETQQEVATNHDRLSDYRELSDKTPYFHLHSQVPMANFIDELAQYDYGLGIYQGALFPGIGIVSCLNGHERHGIATRWFDYVEAGLDILASPEMRFAYRLMRSANVVLPAAPKSFLEADLKRVLIDRMGQQKQLRLNAARHRFDIRENIDRLIRFYRSI